MEIGSIDINKKIKEAIIKQLQTVGCYVDDELPQYIMVMVANNRIQTDRKEMVDNLNLFLNDEADDFVSWLSEFLTKVKVAMESPDFDLCDLDFEGCRSPVRKSSNRKVVESDVTRNIGKHERKRNADEIRRSSNTGLHEEREAKKRVERSHREWSDKEGKENRRAGSEDQNNFRRNDQKNDLEYNLHHRKIGVSKDQLERSGLSDQDFCRSRLKKKEQENETPEEIIVQVNDTPATNKISTNDVEVEDSQDQGGSATAVLCRVDGDVDFAMEVVSADLDDYHVSLDKELASDDSIGDDDNFAPGIATKSSSNPPGSRHSMVSAECYSEELERSIKVTKISENDLTADKLNMATEQSVSVEGNGENRNNSEEEEDEDEYEEVRRPTVASKVIIAPKDNNSEDKEEIRRRAEEIRRRTIASKIVEVRSDYSRQTSAEYVEEDDVELDYNETENESEGDMHENRVVNFDQEKSGLPTITVNFADNSPKKDQDKYKHGSKSSNGGRCNDKGSAHNNYHSSFLRKSSDTSREERRTEPNIEKDDFRHTLMQSRSDHDVHRIDRKNHPETSRHDRYDHGERRHSRATEHEERLRKHDHYQRDERSTTDLQNRIAVNYKPARRRHSMHSIGHTNSRKNKVLDNDICKTENSSHSKPAVDSDLRQLLGRRDVKSDVDTLVQHIHKRLDDENQRQSKSTSEQLSKRRGEKYSKSRSAEKDVKQSNENNAFKGPVISSSLERDTTEFAPAKVTEVNIDEGECAYENKNDNETKVSDDLERVSDVELESEKEDKELDVGETILLEEGEDSVEEVEEEVEIEVEVSDNDPAENENEVIGDPSCMDGRVDAKEMQQRMEVYGGHQYERDEIPYEPCRTPVHITPAESSDGTPIKDEPYERRYSDRRSKRPKHHRKRGREQHDRSSQSHDYHRTSMQEKMSKVQRLQDRHSKSADHSRRSCRLSSRNNSRNSSRHNSPDDFERSYNRNRHGSSRIRTPEEKRSRSRPHSYVEKESKKHRDFLHDQHEMKTPEQHSHKTHDNVFKKSLEMIQNVTHHYTSGVNGDQAYSKPSYVSPNFHRLPLDDTRNRSMFPVMLGNSIPVKPLIFTAPVLRPVNLVRPLNNVQAVDKSKLHPNIMHSPSEKITLTPIHLPRPMTNFVPNMNTLPQYNIVKQNIESNSDKAILPAVPDTTRSIHMDKTSLDTVKANLLDGPSTLLKSRKCTDLTENSTDALALLCSDQVTELPLAEGVSEVFSDMKPRSRTASATQLITRSDFNLITGSAQASTVSLTDSLLAAETSTEFISSPKELSIVPHPVEKCLAELPSTESSPHTSEPDVLLPTEPVLPFLTDTAPQLPTQSVSPAKTKTPELSKKTCLQPIMELSVNQNSESSATSVLHSDSILKHSAETDLQESLVSSSDIKVPDMENSAESQFFLIKPCAENSESKEDNGESTEDDDDSETDDSGSSDDSDDSDDDDEDDESSESSGSEEDAEKSYLGKLPQRSSKTILSSISISKVVTVPSLNVAPSVGVASSAGTEVTSDDALGKSKSQVFSNSAPVLEINKNESGGWSGLKGQIPEISSSSLKDVTSVSSSANMSGMMFALHRATLQKHKNKAETKADGTMRPDINLLSLKKKSIIETPVRARSPNSTSLSSAKISAVSISSVESITAVSIQPSPRTTLCTTKATESNTGFIGMSPPTDVMVTKIASLLGNDEIGKVAPLLQNVQPQSQNMAIPLPPCLSNIPTHIQPSFVQPNGLSNHMTPQKFPTLPPGAPPLPPFVPPHGIPVPPAPVIQPVSQSSVLAKIQQRCQIWPDCRNSSCNYIHPSENCKMFPNCVYGQSCFYIHPPCMFGDRCTNSACLFMHISTKTFSGCSSSPCTDGERCLHKKVDPPKEPTRSCSFGAGKENQTMFCHDTPRLLNS